MPAVNETTPPDRVVLTTRAAAVASTLGLIALGLAWELWLAPIGRGTLALKVLPLLVPLVGLLKFRMFTYRWLSLMVWIYFIEGSVRATSERGLVAGLAWAEVGLSVLLFVACATHVRWRLHQARQKAAPTAQSNAAKPAEQNAEQSAEQNAGPAAEPLAREAA